MTVLDLTFLPEIYREDVELYARWKGRTDVRLEARVHEQFKLRPASIVLEARTKALLEEDGVSVANGESIEGGGFEFECLVGEVSFQTEVVSIGVEPLTERLGFPENPEGAFHHGPPVAWLREHTLRIERKREQLSKATKPLLLVAGSPHFISSHSQVDPRFIEWTHCDAGHSCSLFSERFESNDSPLVPPEVSAILFFAPGATLGQPHNGSRLLARGVLNPHALRLFNTEWMPLREWCTLDHFDSQRNPVCRWWSGSPRRQIAPPR